MIEDSSDMADAFSPFPFLSIRMKGKKWEREGSEDTNGPSFQFWTDGYLTSSFLFPTASKVCGTRKEEI